MSQINPFTGSILQSTQVQRQQATDKDRQVRRAHDKVRNSALTEDQIDHQVESTDELHPIQPEQRHERRFKRPRHQPNADPEAGEESGLDLTA
jgi:hypothetical protein